MTSYVGNRNDGKTDESGHIKAIADIFGNLGVCKGLSVGVPGTLGMTVQVAIGSALVPYNDYCYQAWIDSIATVGIPTADTSNPRIDRIIAYVDVAMTPQQTTSNNPGMFKFVDVPGTPAASPVAVSDNAVNTAVSNNPWIELSHVLVGTGVTQIPADKITDMRTFAKLLSHNLDYGSQVLLRTSAANGDYSFWQNWKPTFVTTRTMNIRVVLSPNSTQHNTNNNVPYFFMYVDGGSAIACTSCPGRGTDATFNDGRHAFPTLIGYKLSLPAGTHTISFANDNGWNSEGNSVPAWIEVTEC